jgi:hypothetical protein
MALAASSALGTAQTVCVSSLPDIHYTGLVAMLSRYDVDLAVVTSRYQRVGRIRRALLAAWLPPASASRCRATHCAPLRHSSLLFLRAALDRQAYVGG